LPSEIFWIQGYHANFVNEVLFNAIEHGTDFCERGTIDFLIKANRDAVFAVVKQPTPGITPEQLQELLRCQDINQLLYFPEIPGVDCKSIGYARGNGLAKLVNQQKPRVWFDLYTEKSPDFRVLILDTKKKAEADGDL
ncbi:hypothetical protein ACFL10_00515, partial [Patescibacteria group bacterium]